MCNRSNRLIKDTNKQTNKADTRNWYQKLVGGGRSLETVGVVWERWQEGNMTPLSIRCHQVQSVPWNMFSFFPSLSFSFLSLLLHPDNQTKRVLQGEGNVKYSQCCFSSQRQRRHLLTGESQSLWKKEETQKAKVTPSEAVSNLSLFKQTDWWMKGNHNQCRHKQDHNHGNPDPHGYYSHNCELIICFKRLEVWRIITESFGDKNKTLMHTLQTLISVFTLRGISGKLEQPDQVRLRNVWWGVSVSQNKPNYHQCFLKAWETHQDFSLDTVVQLCQGRIKHPFPWFWQLKNSGSVQRRTLWVYDERARRDRGGGLCL